jgi:two-component system, NarL family, nitrate/nitrite response regulator NarL
LAVSTPPLQATVDPSASTSSGEHTDAPRMRVLIVDDHRLFADALRPLLEGHGVTVVGVATTARDALALVREQRPNLVLLDLGLPDADGVEVGATILAERPGTRVLAIDGLNSPQAIRDVIQAGFHGYLTKDVAAAQLIHSIHAALDGQVTIPHGLASAAAGARTPSERRAELLAARLTRRETEILALLVEGVPTRAIADRLGLSANTVRTHIQSMLGKLGVHSRLEAATFAVRHGLVRLHGEKRYA